MVGFSNVTRLNWHGGERMEMKQLLFIIKLQYWRKHDESFILKGWTFGTTLKLIMDGGVLVKYHELCISFSLLQDGCWAIQAS